MSTKTPHPKSTKPIHAFYALVILCGFVHLMIPSTIHMIMKHYSISAGTAGMLPLMYFSGILVMALFITHLIKLLSVKQLMSLGALLVSVSLILASQSKSFDILAILYFFVGIGNGVMMMLPGVYITHHYSEQNAQLQTTIFSFLGLGFVIGPLFPGLMSYLELSWRWCFAFPGLLIIPAIIPVLLANHEPMDKAEKLTVRIIKEIINFDSRFFFGVLGSIIIGAGASAGFLTWLITFLESERGTSMGTAHVILALIGFSSVIGRVIWGKVAHNITVFRTLLIIIPTSAFLVLVAPIPENAIINIVLFFITTLFISGVNPLFVSAAGVYPKTHSSSAYTLLFLGMSIGGIIIPFVIGKVFELKGGIIGMSSLSVFFIAVFALLFIIKKEIPISKHINRNPFP